MKGPDPDQRQPLRGCVGGRKILPVGYTYGYSRLGPYRGHFHLTSHVCNFCVALRAQAVRAGIVAASL